MIYSYVHYSGAGNAFFYIDNRGRSFPCSAVPKVCHGCEIDGVILLETSKKADYRMRIFNADGSEAEMCGNGLRCFVKYLEELHLIQNKCVVETMAGLYEAWITEDQVRVRMRPPTGERWNLAPNLHFLNTGVPHAVLFVESVDAIDVPQEGAKLRYHPLFSPAGANANFVSVKDKQTLFVRTYERGVERETLACGTGAVASALASARCFGYSSPINVVVRSGDTLKIFFSPDFEQVEMQGPTKRIQKGTFSLNNQTSIMHAL